MKEKGTLFYHRKVHFSNKMSVNVQEIASSEILFLIPRKIEKKRAKWHEEGKRNPQILPSILHVNSFLCQNSFLHRNATLWGCSNAKMFSFAPSKMRNYRVILLRKLLKYGSWFIFWHWRIDSTDFPELSTAQCWENVLGMICGWKKGKIFCDFCIRKRWRCFLVKIHLVWGNYGKRISIFRFVIFNYPHLSLQPPFPFIFFF